MPPIKKYINPVKTGKFMGEKVFSTGLDFRVENFISLSDKIRGIHIDNGISWSIYFEICFTSMYLGGGVYMGTQKLDEIGLKLGKTRNSMRLGLNRLLASGLVIKDRSYFRLNPDYIWVK